jgi:hypothetical protein
MAASLATAGVLALRGHAGGAGAKLANKIAAGAGLVGLGGKFATDSQLDDAKRADEEIASLQRSSKRDAPAPHRSHPRKIGTPHHPY